MKIGEGYEHSHPRPLNNTMRHNRAARLFFAAVLGVFLTAASSLEATITGANSVEWLTCASEIVATGRVVKVSTVKGPGDVLYTDCVLEVAETIKGPPLKEVTFCYRELADKKPEWLTPGREFLVMLSRWKDSYTDAQIASGGFSDPYYETRMHNLLVPTSDGQLPLSLIDLSQPLKNLYTKDARTLTDKSELLGICRAWSRSPIANSLMQEVPMESPIHRELWGGSSVFLIVPAEDEYRARFLAQARSQDSYARQSAAAELWKFPGEDTETVLRELLNDRSENTWMSSNDTIARIEYGVRAAASRSLQELGKPVPQLELERKPTAAEMSAYRREAWRKSFKAALPEGWKTTAIADGDTISSPDGDKTVVLVDISNGSAHGKCRLVPKEWDKSKLPESGFAGMYEADSQGGRYFYFEGDIPESVKLHLIQYFGLVPGKS